MKYLPHQQTPERPHLPSGKHAEPGQSISQLVSNQSISFLIGHGSMARSPNYHLISMRFWKHGSFTYLNNWRRRRNGIHTFDGGSGLYRKGYWFVLELLTFSFSSCCSCCLWSLESQGATRSLNTHFLRRSKQSWSIIHASSSSSDGPS
mgnify:CR=1 FL=1